MGIDEVQEAVTTVSLVAELDQVEKADDGAKNGKVTDGETVYDKTANKKETEDKVTKIESEDLESEVDNQTMENSTGPTKASLVCILPHITKSDEAAFNSKPDAIEKNMSPHIGDGNDHEDNNNNNNNGVAINSDISANIHGNNNISVIFIMYNSNNNHVNIGVKEHVSVHNDNETIHTQSFNHNMESSTGSALTEHAPNTSNDAALERSWIAGTAQYRVIPHRYRERIKFYGANPELVRDEVDDINEMNNYSNNKLCSRYGGEPYAYGFIRQGIG